jgi:hypothetical protein
MKTMFGFANGAACAQTQNQTAAAKKTAPIFNHGWTRMDMDEKEIRFNLRNSHLKNPCLSVFIRGFNFWAPAFARRLP